jgi:DNA-directed RNA polymerase specialized sigma24 family protein
VTGVDDGERVRRILAGDQGAFRTLFDEFFPRLYRSALAHLARDQDEARDVVQQTFLPCDREARRLPRRGRALHVVLPRSVTTRSPTALSRARLAVARRHLEDSPQLEAVLNALSSGDLDLPEVDAAARRRPRRAGDARPTAEHYAAILEWKYVDELSVNDIAGSSRWDPRPPNRC